MSNSDRDPQGTNAGVCQRYVLGVDGGGTKTEAWLANCGVGLLPARLGVGTGGPSNPHAVGLEAAQQNILATVQAAFSVAQVKPHPVAAACLALAGVGRESIREAMQAWSQSVGFAERVQVVHDAQAVLHAGADTGCGVALISGTGSFAYGETSLGRSRTAAAGVICGATKAAVLRWAVPSCRQWREPATAADQTRCSLRSCSNGIAYASLPS